MPIYKDEKRGSWYFDIRYRDSLGKVRSIKRRGFDTEQKAKNAEKKMLRSMSIDDLPKSSRTLHDIGMEYIDNKRHDINPNTYRQYVQKLEYFIPDVKISSVTPRVALNWRNSLGDITTPIKQIKGGTTGGKPYATRTKNDIIKQYRSIFRYAIEHDYIQRDPTLSLELYKKEYEDYFKYGVVNAKDFFSKWNNLPETTWTNMHFKLITLVAFSSGARRGELKGLYFKDYNGSSINIYKTVSGKRKGDRNKLEKTKTPTSIREISLDSFTNKKLDEYITLCKDKGKYNPDYFLFGFENSLAVNTIQDAFRRMDLGIRFHDLRHSHATILLEDNVPINVVSKRLGHADVNTTLRTYAHVLEKESELTLDSIEKSIGSWGYNGDTL